MRLLIGFSQFAKKDPLWICRQDGTIQSRPSSFSADQAGQHSVGRDAETDALDFPCDDAVRSRNKNRTQLIRWSQGK